MNTIPCPPMNDPRYIDIYTIIYHTTRTTIRNPLNTNTSNTNN